MNIPLNIDWQQILLHFFNFSILVGGLYLLLFKPVKSFMAKREKHYADMESAAQEREKSTADLEAAMKQREAEFDAALEEKRAAAAKEAERSVVDIETLEHTNQQLISTLDEVMNIQRDGAAKRRAAEVELGRIEGELKQKLMELRS